MNVKKPDITVLMPAYNAERYIHEAIVSVLKQSFTNIELLIINDGSTDKTEAIIKDFDDERIRLINQSHQGIAAALNIGLLNAIAPYVARFDADDICYSTRLQLQYEFMQANPEYILVGSDVNYMDKHGEHLFRYMNSGYTNEEINERIKWHCPFIHSSVMYKKSIALEIGYEVKAHTFEDYFLWTKFITKGKIHNINQPLIQVRLNPESVTIDEKLRGKRFNELKKEILFGDRIITEEQEAELLEILERQDFMRFKNYSYNILVAKKYLWNNYQPSKARKNVYEAIAHKPFQVTGYGLLLLSCLPQRLVNSFYKRYKPFSQY